jgi:hypothetical protein
MVESSVFGSNMDSAIEQNVRNRKSVQAMFEKEPLVALVTDIDEAFEAIAQKAGEDKFAIPEDESCNTGCEDLLCAVCCNHLSIAQLLRHTTDYETYNASCCSETGVPRHVPSIV